MTTPWQTFAGQTAVQHDPTQAQAWQSAPRPIAFQQPTFQPHPPAQGQPFNQGGMPPQGPGFGGYQGFQPPAPKSNKTALMVSLVVAAVILIGGGVTTFVLLNKSETVDASKGSGVATSQSTGTDSPLSTHPSSTQSAAPSTATSTEHSTTEHSTAEHSTTEHSTTERSTPSQTTTSAPPSSGAGDMKTAQALAEAWVSYLNDSHYETASALVCLAQQQEFVDSFGGQPIQNKLEVVSVEADGDTVAATVGAVGDTSSTTTVTMWPTNTGFFLICDNPLSDADLNWGAN